MSKGSTEQKERWLSLLKSRIKAEKEKEEPKTIPLRVYGKGINTFAVCKTLPVSNSDSTNEVIRLALQQFGIIGNVKDFQLWVVSKRDNTPYPLIGHEFPFSIQMNHVRHSAFHSGGGRAASSAPAELQMQVYRECQFILKPRPVEPPQQHVPADYSQKPFKRRRSLISWAFWRGSSSHLNELMLSGAVRGCLFGQNLSAVCAEDALPKPVMDMLLFLYHEGSWTRGIFRRPAGARAVRELRESLDSGALQLPFTRDHVFIIAGVFKDFLRSIPSSLLGCELYEEWMDVLEEEEEEEEQVQDVKRMICRLAKQNSLLLRYLLALLHGIQSNAQENQMTSFNLSVCIAPSLLWPPGAPSSPELEGEGTKKVCELVRFMIEHCPQILGEDPSTLFGGPPRKLDSDETGSESWVYPQTDSSCDSLDNELDDSSGGSPGFCSRRRRPRPKPLQSSLDSILTFSDYDHDADPELLHPKPEGLRGVRLNRADRRGRPETPGEDISSTLDSLSLEGTQTQRRRSEPAIAYTARFCPYISGSTDRLTAEDEDAEEEGQRSHTHTQSRIRKQIDSRSLGLGTSSSSLSSTPTSPAHTRSSIDSLSGEQTGTAEKDPTSNPSPPPFTSSSAQTSGEHTNRGGLPKDPVHWGVLKGCIGLHPNSWLKKDRRLSLTQQEGLDMEDDKNMEGGTICKLSTAGKPERGGAKLITSSQSKPRTSRRGSKDAGERGESRLSEPDPSLHRSAGSFRLSKSNWTRSSEPPPTVQIINPDGDVIRRRAAANNVTEEKQSSSSLFYKHSGPSLSLFRRNKTLSVEEHNDRLCQRRGSEPGRQVMDRASTFTRARLPSDPGLKVSDSQGGTTTEARFCLSPCTTKVVRDYFSSPQSSQEVVEGRREWLKRCSDLKAESDLEQLLFAEESYV